MLTRNPARSCSIRITDRLNVISQQDEVYEDAFCLGDCSALEKKAPPTGQST